MKSLDVETLIDLDTLRGWSEYRDDSLRAAHRLPPLAGLHLVKEKRGVKHTRSYYLYGEDLLLGRFQAHYSPVDLQFADFEDHELYKLGAPHVRIYLHEDVWNLQVISPRTETRINGALITELRTDYPLLNDDRLHLGIAELRFQCMANQLPTNLAASETLIQRAQSPSLHLLRQGGLAGPFKSLPSQGPLSLGRSHPNPGHLPDTEDWPNHVPLFWDLSGLFDHERRHIGFRHAQLFFRDQDWFLEPLCSRQRTFVNRIQIQNPVKLEPNDEIGLGTILFRFYDPTSAPPKSHRVPVIPKVVDWSAGE